MSSDSDSPPQDEVMRLSAALEAHCEELMQIEGVVGTGVGFASKDDPTRVVIQIFVGSTSMIDKVQQQAGDLLGEDCPLEAIVMPIPRAD